MNVWQNQASVGNKKLIPDICHFTEQRGLKFKEVSWMVIGSSARKQSGCFLSDGDAAMQLPTSLTAQLGIFCVTL